MEIVTGRKKSDARESAKQGRERGRETSEARRTTARSGLPSSGLTRTKARKRKEWDKVELDLSTFDEDR